MKNLSFRELSALGSALILGVVALLYVPDALLLASNGEMREFLAGGNWRVMDKSDELLRLAVVAIVLIIVLQIVFHAIIAALMHKEADEPRDERDHLVEQQARRIAYYVLEIGGVLLAGHLFLNEVPGLLAAHYLVILLVVADIAKYAATFLCYRRMA